MIISKIQAFIMRYPEPNDFNQQRMSVIVRLDTAEGVTGWGEAICVWPEACRGAALLIEEGFAPLVLGRSIHEPEALWRKMKQHSFWYGEGGLASFAISAIDMAIWDAFGRSVGLPLYTLFGGRLKERLPACASIHVNKEGDRANLDEIAGFIDEGYASVKMGFGKRGLANLGPDPDRLIGFIHEVRKTVGPTAGVMVDLGNSVRWDFVDVVRAARAWEVDQLAWLEEPFPPADLESHRRLRDQTIIPVAAGERQWTVDAYRHMLASGGVDIFGIDPARAEGITGFRKAAALIEAGGCIVNAHAWSTAITTAASLHLSVASAATRVFELKPFVNPMQHELVNEPIGHDGGWVAPSSRPGLGVDINENAIAKYRVN